MTRTELLEGLFGPTVINKKDPAFTTLGEALAEGGIIIEIESGDEAALSADAFSSLQMFATIGADAYVQSMDEGDARGLLLQTQIVEAATLENTSTEEAGGSASVVSDEVYIDDDEEDSETPAHEAAPARPSGAPERPARSAPPAKPAAAPKPPERLPLLPEHRNMSRVNKVFQRWRPHFLSWGIRSSGQVTSSMQSVETNLKQSPNVAGRLMQMVSTIKLIIDGHWPHSSTEFERQFGIALPDDFVSAHMPQG